MPAGSRRGSRKPGRYVVTTRSHEEDVGRFLDKRLADDQAARDLAEARIRGLEDVNIANAWESVERDLERGPRSAVLEWLAERREELAEERRADFREWLEAAEKRDAAPTESIARWVYEPDTEDGEIEVTDGRDRRPHTPAGSRPMLEERQERKASEAEARADGGDPE